MLQALILIAAVSCFTIGLAVIRSGTRTPASRAFILFAFLTGIWSGVNLLSGWVIATWTLRLTFVAGAFVPSAAVYWIARFAKRTLSGALRVLIVVFTATSTGLALISLFTPWIARGTVREVDLGPAFSVYAIFLLAGILTTILLCARHYDQSEGTERLQSRYILLGVSLFGVSAFVVSGLLPAFGISAAGRLDSVSALFFVGFSAYAIVRHRLMDTRLIARLSVIYATLGVFTLLMYYGVLWLDNHVFGGSYSVVGYASALVFIPIFLAAFAALSRGIRKVANRYFFASLYDYQSVLDGFSQRVSSTIKLSEVLRAVTDTVTAAMHVESVALAIRKTGDGGAYDLTTRIAWAHLPQMLPVTTELQRLFTEGRAPVLAEDLTTPPNPETLSEAGAFFHSYRVAVAVPFLAKDELIAILLLGRKLSRDAFTSQDLSLLQSIASQATVAIQNARLYTQVKDFSATLEEKVAAQTQDITAKNVQLEKLLKAQSEFLDIASHQLRTPVSIIRGIISMLKDGDLARLPKEKQDQFIENAWEKGAKLDQIINDILAASSLASQKLTVDAATPRILLEDVVAHAVKDFELEAEQRGIDLRWESPATPLPQVVGNASMLEQAIANFISNALKYTPSTKMVHEARSSRAKPGVVTVTMRKDKADLIVSVSDDGIGIPKGEVQKLFQKFSRASNATAMYTDGSGLGLFIVKEIIGGHGGRVWVESEEGKGSTFSFSLPIAHD